MKNLLLATTALVATAGYASAEVAISGSAEIGIVGGDAYGNETQFHTDIDVNFSMSGEADNGLTFGASVDLDENGAFGSTTQGGETYFIAYGGFRLDMGDTDGAFDAALTEIGIGGSIDDAHTTHAGYNGNSGFDGTYDGQIARFSYSASGFTGHLSVEIDDTGALDPVFGLGVAYSTDMSGTSIAVGLGYQTRDDAWAYDELFGLSLSAKMSNGIQGVINYSVASDDVAGVDDITYIGLGLGYSMNALTVAMNYGEYESGGTTQSGFGLAVNYDLGGGLVAQMGYGQSDLGAAGDVDQFSLGLAMSF